MSVHFQALGPLQAEGPDGPLDLGPRRQRALLARLLIDANAVVSTDRLLDDLWSDEAGTDHQSALWVYVSGLRSALEPDRAPRSEGSTLLTRPPGYVLSVPAGTSDVDRFARLLEEGRPLVEADPVRASATLREALELWRGRAFEDFTYEPWAAAEIERLEELRLAATELRIEADLRLGQGAELVPQLEGLRRQHPLREGFLAQLMLALHRAGRTADALRAYSGYAALLGEELGLEPGRPLRTLEERILMDDPDLLGGGLADGAPASGLAVRGYELREVIGEGAFGVVHRAFHPAVGREVAVKAIRKEFADSPTFIRRFESEAQLVARLEHPHIVPLYDFWREPGAAFLVMRLMRGGSLADAIADSALAAERATVVFAQLADALAAAHASGVVHRDIKPSNVLLDASGNAYLADFGVAVAEGVAAPVDADRSLPAAYRAPEHVARGEATTASDLYSLGVLAAQALTGIEGEYEGIRGALDTPVRAVLDRATAQRPEERFTDPRAFADAFAEALGVTVEAADVPEQIDADNPYKGLRAFGVSDAKDFFGRDRVVSRLIGRLDSPGNRARFTVVVGPSGSGKSSVVKAGLLPAVRSGAVAGSEDWFIAGMTPGMHPFETLEEALLGLATTRPPSMLGTLTGESGIRRAIQQVLPDGAQLLLVVDQFEELYTLADESDRERFIDALVEVVEDSHAPCRVVVTLRADFYDHPLRHPGLGELTRRGTEVITPMTRDELAAAIAGPAHGVGVEVAPEVVERIVEESLDRPSALPLLQFALTELFEQRRGRIIDTDSYEATGGVSGSLLRRADSILEGLTAGGRNTARQVFLRLVSLGEDGASDTRRRILVSELTGIGESGEAQTVLDTFGRHRLLSFDRDPISRGPTVEIAHESLLTEWDTFREWIEEARDDLITHRRVVAAMREWEQSDRSEAYLLSGGRLTRARAWVEGSSLDLSEAERDFVGSSVAAHEAREETAAEQERQSRESAARATRRTRQLALTSIVTVVVVGLAIMAFWQRQEAEAARQESAAVQQSVALASASQATLVDDPELAALLAVEAMRSSAHAGFVTPEALDATHWALQGLGVTYPVTDDTPAYVRLGPYGAAGVWGLSPSELGAIVGDEIDRTMTPEECAAFNAGEDCPRAISLADADVLGGKDAYASQATWDQVTVEIIFGGGEGDVEIWWAFADLGEQLGFTVVPRAPDGMSVDLVQGHSAPLHVVAQPGIFTELRSVHRLVDVSAFLDEAELERSLTPYFVSLARADESIVGLPLWLDLKTMMWGRAGADVPSGWDSWDEFETDLAAIAETGTAPFCLGLGSWGSPGWTGSDIIESLVLRSHGPEVYDAWVTHEIPFDDPRIVEQFTRLGRLVANGWFHPDGPTAAMTNFWEVPGALWFAEEPACAYMPMASFIQANFGEVPAEIHPYPGIHEDHRFASIGGAGYMIAIEDRPEVRMLLEAMASPEWLSGTVGGPFLPHIPLHRDFDTSLIASDSWRRLVEEVQETSRVGTFRYDGSDLMPPAIGPGSSGVAGLFPLEVQRLFMEATPENHEALALEITQGIEAAWVELEATGEG